MDSKVCVASLLLLAHLSSAHGAVIHSEVGRVFQKVQDVLVNADTFATTLGMRVKRDTGDWDKEFDMEALGLSFKIKYFDPSHPFLGGQAYLKFPGHRFVKAANFDDVELKLDFKGSNGQLNMTIEYKFIQKSGFFADRPQTGVVRVSAVTNHGIKNNFKMSLERNATKEFEIDADGELIDDGIKLHGQVSFEHNNVWEMFIDLSSKIINIRFIQNGLEYSVVANSFFDHKRVRGFCLVFCNHYMLKVDVKIAYPGHKHSFQVEHSFDYEPILFTVKIAGDFHGPFGFEANLGGIRNTLSGKLWLYNGDKTYALIDLAVAGDFRKEKYVVIYSFMDGWPQFKTEGKANIHYDRNPYKKLFTIDFIQNGFEYSVAANSFFDYKKDGRFCRFFCDHYMFKVDVKIAYLGHRHSFQVEHSFSYEPNLFTVKIAGDFHGPFGFEANIGGIRNTLSGKLWLYNADKTYALIDLAVDFRKEKYVVTYSFMDGWPQFKTEGKANIHYDRNPYKKLITIDYIELNGKKGRINVEFEPQNPGFKYLMDITHDGKKILKQEKVGNISRNMFEATSVVKTEADETSPFYKLYCYYMYPAPCTTSIQTTRKYSIHRNTNFTYEEETLHGVEKFSSMKIDTTNTSYSFTWEVIKDPDFYPFEGKIDLTVEQKPDGFESMFKFDKDGKIIVIQNLDITLGRSGLNAKACNFKVDHELDEDFYTINKWFGSLIHPVPQWKKGTTTFNLDPDPGDATLDIKLDSLNYIFKSRTGYSERDLQTKVQYNIPVAPEWCPLEGEFTGTIRPLLGIYSTSLGNYSMMIGANTTYIYKHEGTTYLEGEHYFLIDLAKSGSRGQSLRFKKFAKIAVYENSSIYGKLCGETYPLNCSNVYEYETRFYIDSRNTTMDLHLETKQDGKTAHLFKIDAMNKPYQLVWSQPESSTGILKQNFGVERIEITADYEAGKELIVNSNVAEMNLILRKQPNLFMEFTIYGETYLKFSHQVDQDHLAIETIANLYIPSSSRFCVRHSYFEGCYNKWEGELKVFVDRKNKNVYLNKHSVNAFVKKNTEVIFQVEQSTNVSPYVLKIKSPHLMDMLFDDPHKHALDLTVEHQEGKLLHIQTSHPEINSLKIIDRSKLELNGKELVDYKISDNKLTVTYQLPGGEKAYLQLVCSGWNQWVNPKNQGSLKIKTPAAKFNLDVAYDVTDVKNGHMMMNVQGENPKIGKYEFVRKADWNVSNAKVVIAWDGRAQFEKRPLGMFSPIDTKAHVDYDVTNMVLTGNIGKDIAGQKWRFEVTDNKVSLSSQ